MCVQAYARGTCVRDTPRTGLTKAASAPPGACPPHSLRSTSPARPWRGRPQGFKTGRRVTHPQRAPVAELEQQPQLVARHRLDRTRGPPAAAGRPVPQHSQVARARRRGRVREQAHNVRVRELRRQRRLVMTGWPARMSSARPETLPHCFPARSGTAADICLYMQAFGTGGTSNRAAPQARVRLQHARSRAHHSDRPSSVRRSAPTLCLTSKARADTQGAASVRACSAPRPTSITGSGSGRAHH